MTHPEYHGTFYGLEISEESFDRLLFEEKTWPTPEVEDFLGLGYGRMEGGRGNCWMPRGVFNGHGVPVAFLCQARQFSPLLIRSSRSIFSILIYHSNLNTPPLHLEPSNSFAIPIYWQYICQNHRFCILNLDRESAITFRSTFHINLGSILVCGSVRL